MSLSTSTAAGNKASTRRRTQRVTLQLDETILESLQKMAALRDVSLSKLVNSLLAKDVGSSPETSSTALLQRIRQRQESMGPMPDSTLTIRRFRDRM